MSSGTSRSSTYPTRSSTRSTGARWRRTWWPSWRTDRARSPSADVAHTSSARARECSFPAARRRRTWKKKLRSKPRREKYYFERFKGRYFVRCLPAVILAVANVIAAKLFAAVTTDQDSVSHLAAARRPDVLYTPARVSHGAGSSRGDCSGSRALVGHRRADRWSHRPADGRESLRVTDVVACFPVLSANDYQFKNNRTEQLNLSTFCCSFTNLKT